MDLFVLKATLGLDTSEYDEGLDRAGKKASVFGDVLKANLVSKGIEVAVKGMAKLGKATVDMVSQSVNAYADYEQLVGGVETLFKGAADKVKQYAQDAYINAGLSANEYMETVTSFSASLIQSLGGNTSKAAEMANMAIEDMSDNANKMGSDMASIQVAYAGFAKQNYTMLDNLKLGYGGTKSEMDRLIKDAMRLDKTFKVATKTTGKGKKANKELAYSYADIVQAIHIVQNEMGITGTTAKEAEKTISGSLNMMKAAWQNLLTGLGEGSDEKVDMLVEQLIYSAEKVLDNMLPVIENVLYGIVTMIEGLAPVIADKLPAFVERILPPLTKATATLAKAFTKALIQNMPVIIKCAKDILKEVFKAIQEEAPGLLPIILGVGGVKAVSVGTKAASGIKSLLTSLGIIKGAGTAAQVAANAAGNAAATAGGQMAGAATGAGALTTALGAVAAAATGVIAGLAIVGVAYEKTDKQITENAKEQEKIRQTEVQNALDSYKKLYYTKGPEIAASWAETVYGITGLTDNLYQNEVLIQQKINGLYKEMPKNLWDSLKQEWNKFFGPNGEGFLGLLKAAIVDPIANMVKSIHDWGFDLITSFGNGLKQAWEGVKNWFSGALQWLKDRIHFSEPDKGPLSDFHTYAPDMMRTFAQGIRDNAHLVTKAAEDSFNLHPYISGGAAGQEFTVPRTGGASSVQAATMEIDRAVFARLIFKLYNEEAGRVGVNLAGVNI